MLEASFQNSVCPTRGDASQCRVVRASVPRPSLRRPMGRAGAPALLHGDFLHLDAGVAVVLARLQGNR